jgi:hypothetical protein
VEIKSAWAWSHDGALGLPTTRCLHV